MGRGRWLFDAGTNDVTEHLASRRRSKRLSISDEDSDENGEYRQHTSTPDATFMLYLVFNTTVN